MLNCITLIYTRLFSIESMVMDCKMGRKAQSPILSVIHWHNAKPSITGRLKKNVTCKQGLIPQHSQFLKVNRSLIY